MLLIHPQFSHITAIKLCNCFEVAIGLMAKSLNGFLPLRQLSTCIFVVTGCNDTPSKTKWITSPCSKGYSISDFCIFTHLPIGPLLCKALENLPGLCGWICVRNSLLNWGTLQMIGVQGWGSHSEIMLNTIIAQNKNLKCLESISIQPLFLWQT